MAAEGEYLSSSPLKTDSHLNDASNEWRGITCLEQCWPPCILLSVQFRVSGSDLKLVVFGKFLFLRYSEEELNIATESFDKKCLLGSGSFGQVPLGRFDHRLFRWPEPNCQ